jgi:hypothetical protein
MKHVLIAFMLGLLNLVALPTLAADPFTVARVPVDATAGSAIEAQTRAIGNGQIVAARTLLDRLTIEEERAQFGTPALTTETVGPLIRGLSIDNERRSPTRYLGDVTIAFNPSAVQRFLRDNQLTMVSSQAGERLFVPVGFDPEGLVGKEILSGRYAHALTPVRAPSADDIARLYQEPSREQLQSLAARYGVDQIFVVRRGGNGLTGLDISLSRDETARYTAANLQALVAQLEADWKAVSALPSAQTQTATVSVLYASLPEWQQLQSVLNNSAQVSDARLDALSKDGALMTIRFGDFDRLVAEMSQKGVRVYEDPALGLVFRR